MIGPVKIQVLGTESLIRNIKSKQARALNMEPILRVLVKDFRSIMRQQFDSQGAYLGEPWEPLSPITIKTKVGDPRILHRTRRMRKSFTVGTGGLRNVGPHHLVIDSEVPYAGFHQSGTSKMPQRIIFKFGPDVNTRWRIAMTEYLARGVIKVIPG